LTRSAGLDDNVVMQFEVLGNVTEIETIAVGRSIRELARLKRVYGRGRWRKLKGMAAIRFSDGAIGRAELHWYEAHGFGRKELNQAFDRELTMARKKEPARFVICVQNR